MTMNLCRQIFADEDVGEQIRDRTPEYEALLKVVLTKQKGKKGKMHKHVLRRRREVI